MSGRNENANHAGASGNSETTNNLPQKSHFSSTTRLTSFLTPRDLTLGGNSIKLDKPKKVYTPNLNAQRKKKEDEPAAPQKTPRGPKNKHKERDRGNRHKPNTIQSAGVFAEGFADGGRSRGRFSGYRESGDRSNPREPLLKPKLNAGRVVDKEEEEHKLKMLLRDDFIEDDKELEFQTCPITLPIFSEKKLFKEEIKVEPKEEMEDEGEEKEKTAIFTDKKKFLGKEKLHKDIKEEKKIPLNIEQRLEPKTNGYFLIRFVDCLGTANEPEEEETRPRKNAQQKVESENPKLENPFTNLKEGFLGKLQILKSGAARLSLGEHNLAVELGVDVTFREDLVAAKLDNENKNGEIINLGSIHTNLICTPDWEDLLKLPI